MNDIAPKDRKLRSVDPPAEVRFYLKFEMEGVADPFLYVVSEAEWNQVSAFFLQHFEIETPTPHFIGFTDRTGRLIYINPTFIRRHQSLFEAGIYEDKIVHLSNEDRDADPVTIYVYDLAEPYHYDQMELEDIRELNDQLLLHHNDGNDFIVFNDYDGEQNSLRWETVMLVESWPYEFDEDSQVSQASQ